MSDCPGLGFYVRGRWRLWRFDAGIPTTGGWRKRLGAWWCEIRPSGGLPDPRELRDHIEAWRKVQEHRRRTYAGF